ncbi:acyltransferase family protein [Hyphomonas atlantica corrig.]|uniref:acyltransferase family protein n=1 Tax=Hyphomonas atlantica TaxID=1280948 RepID=UPI00235468CB|nr:acyltransferase family protein [Hyphomonas atlantica]
MPHAPAFPRRYDLDWLRIIAFGLLILYHSGMFYVTWGWHVKSVHAGPEAEWAMLLLNPWRLSLLFFISGVALRFAADKLGGGKLARERSVRLGLPILFGMTLIVAPQSWLQLVEAGEFSGSFWAFWPRYLDFNSDFSVTTPTWNHLWYIVYLLAYTLLLAPFAGRISRLMHGPSARMTQALFTGRWGPAAVLVLPVLPHVLYRITLDPHFPITHDLTNDWANHAHSLTMLMLGFVLAKDAHFWSAIRRALPAAIALVLILGIGLSAIWAQWETLSTSGEWDWIIWPARMARLAYAWIAIAVLLGLAQIYLNRPSRALTYMTEAIFPWYILHQTLTVMLGYWLTRQGLPVGLEAVLVIGGTFAGCALLHELVIRRVGFLRPLFGLKPASPSGAARKANAAGTV